jgi:hypothetical protein
MADDTSHDNIPVDPKACHAEELADRARIWNQTIHDLSESDKDSDCSESPMGIDDSDEEDDWSNIEENDCPQWQVGLTAGKLVEEEFKAEAIVQGGFSTLYLLSIPYV